MLKRFFCSKIHDYLKKIWSDKKADQAQKDKEWLYLIEEQIRDIKDQITRLKENNLEADENIPELLNVDKYDSFFKDTYALEKKI